MAVKPRSKAAGDVYAERVAFASERDEALRAAVKDYLMAGFQVAGVPDTIAPERFYPTVGAAVAETTP